MRATNTRTNGTLSVWPLAALGLLALTFVVSTAFVNDVPRASAAHTNTGPAAPGPRPDGRVPMAPDGVPAIAPRPDARAGAGAGAPAFAEQDAAQYATGHRMWRNLDGSRPTVVLVRFATSREISALLHTTTGRPADVLLCYVELRGTFTFPGLNHEVTYHRGFEVFAARTGNLLIAGGMP